MSSDRKAIKAIIIDLAMNYPSSLNSMGDSVVNTYVETLSAYSVEAVSRSAQQFREGLVEAHNNDFMPSAPQMAVNVREWQRAIDIKEASQIQLHTGIIEVDFGSGRIDMRGKTLEEQEEIFRNRGLPALEADERPKELAYEVGDAEGRDD